MDFYTLLADYYDLLFPPSREQKAWAFDFAGTGPLLDAGCATGVLACTLAAAGVSCFGFDSDPLMIRKAQARAAGVVPPPEFRVATLQNCSGIYREGFFESIICLGNTLVHLGNAAELTQVLQGFYRLLHPDGRFAVQLLNYDRILKLRPEHLPPLTASGAGTEIRFQRSYRYDSQGIVFHGILERETDGKIETDESETRLLPIQAEQLLAACTETGFRNPQIWEDYGKTPADEESTVYLLTAEKQAG